MNNQRTIIDLTLPIDERLAGANVRPLKSIAKEGWRASTLELYSHCGTHMDATCHFLESGETIDQLNLEACCGMARVVDLTPVGPSELISVEAFESRLTDPIEPGARLLLRTDWHKRYPDPAYRNELPRISPELANYFVKQEVRLIGVEPPSVADVNDIDEVTQVHRILFHGGIVIVEGLVNLDQIPLSSCQFIALPLKIVEGDGCPVRAIAITEGDEVDGLSSFGFAKS